MYRQGIARSTDPNAAFRLRKTEILGLGNVYRFFCICPIENNGTIQSRLGWKLAWFPCVLGNRRRMMPTNNLDAVPAELILVTFKTRALIFLVSSSSYGFTSVPRTLPLVQIDPRSFISSDVNTSTPSVKNDAEIASSPAAYYLLRKRIFLITSIPGEEQVSACLLACISEKLTVAVGQFNCSLNCLVRRADRRSRKLISKQWYALIISLMID